jgi:transposase-like protein
MKRGRSFVPLEQRKAIAERIANGESQAAVARDVGCHPQTVRKFMAEFGVVGVKATHQKTERTPRPEFRERFERIGLPPCTRQQ